MQTDLLLIQGIIGTVFTITFIVAALYYNSKRSINWGSFFTILAAVFSFLTFNAYGKLWQNVKRDLLPHYDIVGNAHEPVIDATIDCTLTAEEKFTVATAIDTSGKLVLVVSSDKLTNGDKALIYTYRIAGFDENNQRIYVARKIPPKGTSLSP